MQLTRNAAFIIATLRMVIASVRHGTWEDGTKWTLVSLGASKNLGSRETPDRVYSNLTLRITGDTGDAFDNDKHKGHVLEVTNLMAYPGGRRYLYEGETIEVNDFDVYLSDDDVNPSHVKIVQASDSRGARRSPAVVFDQVETVDNAAPAESKASEPAMA